MKVPGRWRLPVGVGALGDLIGFQMDTNEELLRLNFMASQAQEQIRRLDSEIVLRKRELAALEKSFENLLINSQQRRFL